MWHPVLAYMVVLHGDHTCKLIGEMCLCMCKCVFVCAQAVH